MRGLAPFALLLLALSAVGYLAHQRKQPVPRSRIISRIQLGLLLGIPLVLVACGAGSQGGSPLASTTPGATALPTTTSAPAQCQARFGGAYQATLPDATFQQTTVYAQIPLPPQTRSYDSDASGLRGRFMCSAGTTDAVLAFMTIRLPQLGWQSVTAVADCGEAVIPHYASPQCWKNGKYHLFLGINSNADWVIAFVDPAFLP